MGFTHVELLPIMEHPFDGSWGYQTTGYFAPTSRFGTPQDLMYLIDYLHQRGIGVILDWVPSHFPTRRARPRLLRRHAPLRARRPAAGLAPGLEAASSSTTAATRCAAFSSATPCSGSTSITSTACASMRWPRCSTSTTPASEGEWIPNRYGGRENLEAIAFLRRFNEDVYRNYPDVLTIAEESTAWPMVSRPTYARRARLRLQVGHGLDARHARSI